MQPFKRIASMLLVLSTAISLTACSGIVDEDHLIDYSDVVDILYNNGQNEDYIGTDSLPDIENSQSSTQKQTSNNSDSQEISAEDINASVFSLDSIPEYSGEPFVTVNDNIPYFSEDDLTVDSFEYYSDLDDLGRCGVTYACISQDLMPTEKRGDISSVKPTGWVQHKYDFVDGKMLYNRCHLIGFQLAGENANSKNLVTGTRYMNVTGMLPFENMVADYVKETDEHVLYRVTPIFDGDNLVCNGVLMEAESVEDEGESVLYNVFVYNVQPGIEIDYATGENWAA